MMADMKVLRPACLAEQHSLVVEHGEVVCTLCYETWPVETLDPL